MPLLPLLLLLLLLCAPSTNKPAPQYEVMLSPD
jgi:hypothetical protein